MALRVEACPVVWLAPRGHSATDLTILTLALALRWHNEQRFVASGVGDGPLRREGHQPPQRRGDEGVQGVTAHQSITVAGIDVGGKGIGFHAVVMRNGILTARATAGAQEAAYWCVSEGAQAVAVRCRPAGMPTASTSDGWASRPNRTGSVPTRPGRSSRSPTPAPSPTTAPLRYWRRGAGVKRRERLGWRRHRAGRTGRVPRPAAREACRPAGCRKRFGRCRGPAMGRVPNWSSRRYLAGRPAA